MRSAGHTPTERIIPVRGELAKLFVASPPIRSR